MASAFRPVLFSPTSRPCRRRALPSPAVLPLASADASREEGVVIVGAGIAGLSLSLALHRLGVRSTVLEQGASLRSGGTSLTLFKNGWSALDAIGVGDQLRPKFLPIRGMVIRSAEDGRELRSFSFADEAPEQEVRAVERKELLNTLAANLPPGTVSFSSKVKTIASLNGGGGSTVVLDDGRRISAKVVVGCDGVNSPVARWVGFPAARPVGHSAFRGLAVYSGAGGQPLAPTVNYVFGRGVRAGFVPVSETKVYWFVCFNDPSAAPNSTSSLKAEALRLVGGWPEDVRRVIGDTPEDGIVKTALVDRWLWPVVSPSAARKGVALAGDAWHPMTPNLAQGACCALEDAVVLARLLAPEVGSTPAKALEEYEKVRWWRVFPMAVRANLVGAALQWAAPAVCAVRDGVVVPRFVRLGPILEHANFECHLS